VCNHDRVTVYEWTECRQQTFGDHRWVNRREEDDECASPQASQHLADYCAHVRLDQSRMHRRDRADDCG
jgi:hypothetical protein